MKRILVAYDDGEPARRALYLAATLAHAAGASVAVMSVIPRRILDRLTGSQVPQAERDRRDRLLQEARRVLRLRGIEPDLLEPVGDPAQSILLTVDAGGYDTVVLGAPPAASPEGSGLSDVPRRVAAHTRATVVIAR